MHLRKNIDDNATFLFAELLNRSTATIFRVCIILTVYYVQITIIPLL